MSELYTTFIISLAVSALLDGLTELLRYCKKSKCKSDCKCIKLNYNEYKSEAEIIPIND